jgi:pyrroloquinoline-quinone synthase
MTTQEFLTELDARIAKYDLLCHPFYKAWAAGDLSRDDLREYGREYFHHVDAFPSYLSEFADRTESGSLRRAVLANRDEEMGADGNPSHAELWLDFVQGMGGDRNIGGEPLVPELAQLVNSFRAVAREGTAEEALATFYAYESQVPRVAAEKARGLKQMYGADQKTCGYFTLHTTADVYHARIWKNQLTKLVDDNSAAADRALIAGESAARALWNALDGVETARLSRAA